MKRKSVNFRKDKRVFSKTADKVHWVNFNFVRPQRGGVRA